MPGYFELPYFVSYALPYLGASALAVLAWLFGGFLGRFLDKSLQSRLQDFAGSNSPQSTSLTQVEMGSFDHRIRLAFIKFGLKADGNEKFYLLLARIAVGAAFFLVMLLVGLPFFTSLVGFLAGFVVVNGLVTRAWNNARADLEGEIPALLSGMKSALSGETDVKAALNEIALTLKDGSPLRLWATNAASRMQTEGQPVIGKLREDAAPISTSLSICVELIGRAWTTGGEGYAVAFESAAANLRDVLQARVLAQARGAGAQGTTNILMGMAFAMIAFLSRSPSLAATIHTPLVQIAYAGIFLMLVYGYNMINEMIDKAV